MNTQVTLQCLPVNHSDQLEPSSNQPITGSRNDVIPGCCTGNIPYIRTCISSARQMEESRDGYSTGGEQEPGTEGERNRREQQRAGSVNNNKSRARDYTLSRS